MATARIAFSPNAKVPYGVRAVLDCTKSALAR